MEKTFVQYIGKFIGPREIKSIEVAHDTTPLGGLILEVFYEGSREMITEKALVIVVTDTAIDFTSLQKKKMPAIVAELMSVLDEYDIIAYEQDAVLRDMLSAINERFNRANNFLWTSDDSKYAPGSDTMDHVKLSDARRIVNSINGQQ